MVFTYSSTYPQSTRDQIRLLIGDTDATDELLQDGEIDSIIALEMGSPSGSVNVFRVGSQCCQAIASQASRLFDQRVDNVDASLSQRATQYRAMAKDLLNRARRSGGIPYVGGISQGDKQTAEADTDRVVPMFSRDMLTAPGTSTGSAPFVSAVWP